MRSLAAALPLVALLAGCGDGGVPPAPSGTPDKAATASASTPAVPAPSGAAEPAPSAPGEQGGTASWRDVASAEDAGRLGRLEQAWRLARAEAEDKGYAAEVEALGPLVDPNAGQSGRLQPPPGTYRCRAIKLVSTVELTPGGDLVLTKTSGSQRTRGLLYPDTDSRLVFVGAQAWGLDETGFPRYGEQPIRDQVGVFERIGSNRWRLVIPWPRVDSKLEILELVR